MLLFTGQLGTARARLTNLVPGWLGLVQIKAKQCFFPVSSWVHAFILTCDDKLAVWFKRGVHHRRHRAISGAPGVCCLYPGSNRALYDLAIAWWSAGHFVHTFLYRIMAYQLVRPPNVPCGDCPPGLVVSCCPNALPPTLHVTFTGAITGTYPLSYDAGHWSGTFTPCGTGPTTIQLVCVGLVGNWTLELVTAAGCQVLVTPAFSVSCRPLSLVFHLTGALGSCCAGQSFTATVTT